MYFYFCKLFLPPPPPDESYWFHETAIALSLLRLKPNRNLQLSKLRKMIKVLRHRQMLSRKVSNLFKAFITTLSQSLRSTCSFVSHETEASHHAWMNVVMIAQLFNCIENGKSLLADQCCSQCKPNAHLIEFLSQSLTSKFKWISKAYDGNFTSANKSLWIKQAERKKRAIN